MNPHVQALQNMCGKEGVEGVLGQFTGAEVHPCFKKNRQYCSVINKPHSQNLKIELANLNHFFPYTIGRSDLVVVLSRMSK